MATLCLSLVIAFSSVKSASNYKLSDNLASHMPTSIRSLIRSSFRAPKSHCSASEWTAVINDSTLSPVSWFHLLNHVRSKITFLLLTQCLLKAPVTAAYDLFWASVNGNTCSISSTSSPPHTWKCSPDIPLFIQTRCDSVALETLHPSWPFTCISKVEPSCEANIGGADSSLSIFPLCHRYTPFYGLLLGSVRFWHHVVLYIHNNKSGMLGILRITLYSGTDIIT